MSDEVIKELWEIKDNIAREHGNDVNRLAVYFRNRPRQPGEVLVDLSGSKSAPKGDAGVETQAPRK